MKSFTPDTTVGEIAAALPLSVRIFEQAGIDFCCGGKLPLSTACAAKGIDPAVMLDRIQADPRPTIPDADWQSAPLGALIDHIVATHHAYLTVQLPRLEAMSQKLLTKHSERHGDVLEPLAIVLRSLRMELDSHLLKEEMVLFPLIRQLEAEQLQGSLRNPIRVMLQEHDSAGAALARFRELTGGYVPPADVCNTFRAFYAELADLERDLHLHIHLENNILFPRAVELEAVAV